MLIRAMLGQQVSVAGAQTAAARLTIAANQRLSASGRRTDPPVPHTDGNRRTWPGGHRRTPAEGQRHLRRGSGDRRRNTDRRPDPECTTQALTADLVARPGIGPWTAGYVAMRLLPDPDVLLTGDLVLRAGAGLLGLPPPAELAGRGQRPGVRTGRTPECICGGRRWVSAPDRNGPAQLPAGDPDGCARQRRQRG